MTKRVAWFTGEPSIKESFTPHKVYEVVREEPTNFSVINNEGTQNFCLKKGCAHICHKDWVFADVVEEENVVESVEDAAQPITTKQPKWSEWMKNTTGKCPEGLKRKQKIKLKWSDGDEFNISKPHDAAWYIDKGGVNITHYKVKLKDQDRAKQSKWTKNTGVCPVDSDVKVEIKMKNGDKECALAKHFSWGFDDQEWDIVKWRLAD